VPERSLADSTFVVIMLCIFRSVRLVHNIDASVCFISLDALITTSCLEAGYFRTSVLVPGRRLIQVDLHIPIALNSGQKADRGFSLLSPLDGGVRSAAFNRRGDRACVLLVAHARVGVVESTVCFTLGFHLNTRGFGFIFIHFSRVPVTLDLLDYLVTWIVGVRFLSR